MVGVKRFIYSNICHVRASAMSPLLTASANGAWWVWQFRRSSTGLGRLSLVSRVLPNTSGLGKYCPFAVSFVPPATCSQRQDGSPRGGKAKDSFWCLFPVLMLAWFFGLYFVFGWWSDFWSPFRVFMLVFFPSSLFITITIVTLVTLVPCD